MNTTWICSLPKSMWSDWIMYELWASGKGTIYKLLFLHPEPTIFGGPYYIMHVFCCTESTESNVLNRKMAHITFWLTDCFCNSFYLHALIGYSLGFMLHWRKLFQWPNLYWVVQGSLVLVYCVTFIFIIKAYCQYTVFL